MDIVSNSTTIVKKEYKKGTKFSDIVSIYNFDAELSHLLCSILSAIEISLRSRFVNALLTYKKDDALILYDPAIFEDKRKYWTNISSLSKEIAYSSDLFIKHNFDKHEGNMPVWAAAEIMSFGTLSKRITNLKTGSDLPFSEIAESYMNQENLARLSSGTILFLHILDSVRVMESYVIF